jgi:hypothetical protein
MSAVYKLFRSEVINIDYLGDLRLMVPAEFERTPL